MRKSGHLNRSLYRFSPYLRSTSPCASDQGQAEKPMLKSAQCTAESLSHLPLRKEELLPGVTHICSLEHWNRESHSRTEVYPPIFFFSACVSQVFHWLVLWKLDVRIRDSWVRPSICFDIHARRMEPLKKCKKDSPSAPPSSHGLPF